MPAAPFGEKEEALVVSLRAGGKGYRPRFLRSMGVVMVVGVMAAVLVQVGLRVVVMVTDFRLGTPASLS